MGLDINIVAWAVALEAELVQAATAAVGIVVNISVPTWSENRQRE